jgi:large subunit ribosomal protein L3
MLGHFNKAKVQAFKYLKEYKIEDIEKYELGQKLNVENFQIGQSINISGLTIGKGNAGNIKRNHFTRGGMSHGSKHHRLQGSIGAGTTPGRVLPGKKMPGRLGMDQITIKNLEIIDIDNTKNLLIIKGSVPGKTGNLLNIKLN